MNTNLKKKTLSICMALLMLLAVPFGMFGANDVVAVQASAIETEEIEEIIADFSIDSLIDYVTQLISSFMEKIFDTIKSIAQMLGLDFCTSDTVELTLEDIYDYSTISYVLSLYDNYTISTTFNYDDPYYNLEYCDSNYIVKTFDEYYSDTVLCDVNTGKYFYYCDGEYKSLAGDVEETYEYAQAVNISFSMEEDEEIISTEIVDDKIIITSQLDDFDIVQFSCESYYYYDSQEGSIVKLVYTLDSETYMIDQIDLYHVYDGVETLIACAQMSYNSGTSGIQENIIAEYESITAWRNSTIIIESGTENEEVYAVEIADGYRVGFYIPIYCVTAIFEDPECTIQATNDTTTGDVIYYACYAN